MVHNTNYFPGDGIDFRTYFAVRGIVTQAVGDGSSDYFFTKHDDPYGATMFALQHADASWNGSLLLGRPTVQPNGSLGFLPDIALAGKVDGVSVDAFAAQYTTGGEHLGHLLQAVLNGRDTLAGSDGDDVLFGFAGRDELIGGDGNDQLSGGRGADRIFGGAGDDKITGGAGDDILRLGSGVFSGGSQTLHGGSGDDFIYYSERNQFYEYGDAGRDVYYVDRAINGAYGYVLDFVTGEDKVQLDPDVFKALKGGYSADNFVSGAPRDSNDFLLLGYQGQSLSYDPDGNGPKRAEEIIAFSGHGPMVWSDIIVGHSSEFSDGGVSAGLHDGLRFDPLPEHGAGLVALV